MMLRVKLLRYILKTIFILFIFSTVAFPQENNLAISADKNIKDEANYISGLYSNSETQKVNSAYMLGEMKSEKALIPLMDMFRKEKNDAGKLVAALSLLKIGDRRGIFLVKRSIELKGNDGVNIILKHLYKDYSQKNNEI
jgi:HEAT repeat protein